MMRMIYWAAVLIAVAAGAARFRYGLGRPGRTVGALLIGAIALSSFSALKARDAARMAAKSAPACIQVPSGGGGYRPAAGLADLSALALRAGGGRFHGVLVVETENGRNLFNWSYRQANWSELPSGMKPFLVIRCAPRRDYLERLGWLTGLGDLGQSDSLFRLGRSTFLIPSSFRPQTQNGTYLQLDAPAPAFSPDAPYPAGLQYRTVNLEFRTRDWLESVASSARAASNLAATAPSSENLPKSHVERDAAGRVVTFIDCPVAQSARNPAPCQHRFYLDGAMWTFRQSMDDLPRWRELQQRLKKRIGEFAAAGQECESDAAAC